MRKLFHYRDEGKIFKFFTCLLLVSLYFSCAQAQGDVKADLEKRFSQYQVNNLQEKLFVHVAKTTYLAGEILWFRVYAVDANVNTATQLSKVAYVEVMNSDQKAVLQAKIAISDSSGSGSFLIPYSLASGNYILRAYTKWMRNFGPQFYYQQPITIINTLKDLDVRGVHYNQEYDIQFFPEGGNMVAGISSKLAYKVINRGGEPVDYKGFIVNQKGDTVVEFFSFKFGMGNVSFMPAANEQYAAIVVLPDTIVKKDLPHVLNEGHVMQLQEQNNDELKITVRAVSQNPDAPVYLLVHTRQAMKKVFESQLKNGETTFLVNRNELGEGVSHFTIFNGTGQPVCERLFFKRPVKNLEVNIHTDRSTYGTREKVSLDLDAMPLSRKTVIADLSVSVFLVDSFQHGKFNPIETYLLLGSELNGHIDSPGYYFGAGGADVAMAADNLVLTQGWSRYKAGSSLENKKPAVQYLPEREGLSLDGKLLQSGGEPARAGTEVYFSVPDSLFTFRTTLSRSDGSISWAGVDFFGRHEIVLQPNSADTGYKVDIVNPFDDAPCTLPVPHFSLAGKSQKELRSRSINMQADNAYLTDRKLHTFQPLVKDTGAFYGFPDSRYYLDDYTRFVTMEEVLKEYVLSIRVRKHAEQTEFRVVDLPRLAVFQDNPLTLIDGVPVFHPEKVMKLDPLKLKRIDVVQRNYHWGNITGSGIISISSYLGDLGGYQLDPQAMILEYEGLQYQREFYSPAYDKSISSSLPDYRNQLYWSPEVSARPGETRKLSFWTPDITGKFMIVVQGISRDGVAGSSSMFFEVK